MQNIQAKTGRSSEDLWKLAKKKGFVKNSKLIATHAEMLAWLKSKEVGLGQVQANFIIAYLRLRTEDPRVSTRMAEWAKSTGYAEYSGLGKSGPEP